MNEQDQGNIGGNTPRQSSVQPEEKTGKHFVRNGFEIFSFDSKAIVSWGLLSGLIGLFVASITVYQSFGSNVDERISNHRELNRKLDKYEWDIQNINRELDKHENQISDIEQYFKPKGKR